MEFEITVAGSGVPYEKIAGPFKTREEAEKYARDHEDPLEKGHSIEEAIDGGGYRISATK